MLISSGQNSIIMNYLGAEISAFLFRNSRTTRPTTLFEVRVPLKNLAQLDTQPQTPEQVMDKMVSEGAEVIALDGGDEGSIC